MIPLKSGNFKPAPAGATHARCVRIIDLGTQVKPKFNTAARTILFGFECPELLMEGGDNAGKPYLVMQRFTASLSAKSKLKPFIEGWFGKPIATAEQIAHLSQNMHTLLGRWALISIAHSDDGEHANITFAAKPMAAFNPSAYPAVINEHIYLSLDPTAFKRQDFEKLSDAIKDVIKRSPEWKTLTGEADDAGDTGAGAPPADDDVPF